MISDKPGRESCLAYFLWKNNLELVTGDIVERQENVFH